MKLSTAQIKNSKGFTLIELIVVIAILGVLAAVLITIINPVDKINAANDAGVISTIAQIGRSETSYAASHNNFYVTGSSTVTDITTPLTALNAAGESSITTYAPVGYTLNYLTSPASPCTSGSTCTGYAIIVTALKSQANITKGPAYQYVNGKGCFVATPITQAQLVTLAGASSGTGACP